MDYTNISLEELNRRVNVVEIAVALGYREDRAKSSKASKFFVLGSKESHWDRILISPSRKHQGQLHFQSFDFNTGGDGASMLVKHALERGIIRDPLAISDDPRNMNIFRKVAKVLCDHLMIPDEERVKMRSVVHELKKGEPFKEEIAKKIMSPGLYPILFSKREITRETFNSPTFKGTWFNCNPEADTHRKKTDLCFPCFKADGSIGGLNYRYWKEDESKCSSRLLTGSEHSESVWHSNIPEKIDRIVITESEFDCMAHYQLNPEKNANTLYISHQGNLIPSQIDCVMGIMRNNIDKLSPDFKFVLGADNDDAGSRYDLQIIKKIAEQKKDTLSLDMPIHPTGPSNNTNSKDIMMGDWIDESGILTTITVTASKYDKFKDLTKLYLEDSHIPSINVRFIDDHNTVQVLRTKNDKSTNTALSELILNSDLLIRNVRREKPIEKDWNDDLKMLNKINNVVWEHFDIPKRIDYQGYRELATDYRLHVAAMEDEKTDESQVPGLKKVNSPELKKLVKEYMNTRPELFKEVPQLVKELEERNQVSPEMEEKLRQAKAMFRR